MSKNDEVKAHQMQPAQAKAAARNAAKAQAHRMRPDQAKAAARNAAKAQAHQLTKTRKQSGKVIAGQAKGNKAEVEAHLFGLGDQIAPKTVPPTTLVPIEFDPNKEEYHPAEE